MEVITLVDPPTMPQGLTVDIDGAFTLRVTWHAPADDGGRAIVNYKLEIRELVGSGPFVELDRVTGVSRIITNSSQFTISENTTYEIRVTAFNSVVLGDSSTAVGTTQPIGPPRPLLTAPTTTNLTNTSVDVSWQFPGGYVDFYNIQYKLSSVEWSSPDSVRDITLMGSQTSVSINRLLPNTTYDLRIRTENANGQSEWSPEATFTTQPTPPSVTIDGPSTIPAGQTVVLVCNVSRDVIVTWSRDDGRPLPNTPDGNMLRIEMPQVEDGGVYRCSAEGVVAMFNLVVMESPTTVTTPPPSVTINGPSTIPAGQTVVLICNVSRDVMVTWSREDGRPLPNTPDGSVLHIEMPQAEDGGVYWCSAGGVVATFNLVVMEPPTTATTPPVTTTLPDLSPGAISGIAVGTIIGLVVIVCILLLVFFCGVLVAGRFQKHKDPAGLPDKTVINLHGNIAYDQVRHGTTDISLHGNVAYEYYNHEQNPADDDQYENLDEYKT